MHIVLLGDSIFDNAAYVPGEPDVVRQLQRRLGGDGRATLLARDGATVSGVHAQVERIPSDATHMVLSAGGNDALGELEFLQRDARSVMGVLLELSAMGESFEGPYRSLVERLGAPGLPLAVCTVYHPNFPEDRLQRASTAGLTVYNDAILRTAFSRGLDVVDLRLICDHPSDYANPIEPSARGGEKIAAAIERFARGSRTGDGRSRVFGHPG